MILLADLVYAIAALLYLPRLLYDMLVLGKNRSGWRERRGRLRELPAGRERVWIHAVSVGEMNATPSLVSELKRLRPGSEIIISTTTDTGYARGCQIFPELYVFRYPLDVSWIVRRALKHLKPSMIVLVELELWHNLVALADRARIPVVVFNGRLSARSVRRFGWIGPLVRPMFGRLSWVGAQDETYAERFAALGTPPDRIAVTGSIKYDTAPTDRTVKGADALRREVGLDSDESLWVCGSTGPGEEQIILRAYRELLNREPQLRLAIIPRKPERFDEVARLILAQGFACFRRSRGALEGKDDDAANPGPTVILGDTMGELRKFYALASVVFVGRSLVPMGGSDVIEVAALAKPILVGPHTENFSDAIDQLARNEAMRTTAGDRLVGDVASILNDPAGAHTLGQNAHKVVEAHRGATDRTIKALLPLLDAAARDDF